MYWLLWSHCGAMYAKLCMRPKTYFKQLLIPTTTTKIEHTGPSSCKIMTASTIHYQAIMPPSVVCKLDGSAGVSMMIDSVCLCCIVLPNFAIYSVKYRNRNEIILYELVPMGQCRKKRKRL
mmetsp:Transcript_10781/g.16209  ORF Transcript_10781/g.16209 Transcript_10781/m.16209 type:complete len:121 (-) Transcript_10781:375-737(-)